MIRGLPVMSALLGLTHNVGKAATPKRVRMTLNDISGIPSGQKKHERRGSS